MHREQSGADDMPCIEPLAESKAWLNDSFGLISVGKKCYNLDLAQSVWSYWHLRRFLSLSLNKGIGWNVFCLKTWLDQKLLRTLWCCFHVDCRDMTMLWLHYRSTSFFWLQGHVIINIFHLIKSAINGLKHMQISICAQLDASQIQGCFAQRGHSNKKCDFAEMLERRLEAAFIVIFNSVPDSHPHTPGVCFVAMWQKGEKKTTMLWQTL